MRARLALAVSGTRHELREVRLAAKPAAMLAVSPKGTVPVLVLADGEVVDESLTIMRRVLAARDPGGWLKHDDAPLIAANDGPFKQHLDRYKYADRHGADPLVHRTEGLRFLRELDALLAAGDPLDGLTGAAIFPFVRQLAAVDRPWFDAQPLPHLAPWLARNLGSALFESIMRRVPPWAPGDPATIVAGA